MDEERVKSALEIAMERISELPELTPEEIAEQKEKEWWPVGLAISNRYLQGQIREDELEADLNGHRGEPGEIVRRAFISNMCQSIQLEDVSKADRAFDGLAVIAGEGDSLEGAQRDFLQVRREFEREKEIVSNKFASLLRTELENGGISGSAVRPNVAGNETWKRNLSGMFRSYTPKLDKIRGRLMDRLQ